MYFNVCKRRRNYSNCRVLLHDSRSLFHRQHYRQYCSVFPTISIQFRRYPSKERNYTVEEQKKKKKIIIDLFFSFCLPYAFTLSRETQSRNSQCFFLDTCFLSFCLSAPFLSRASNLKQHNNMASWNDDNNAEFDEDKFLKRNQHKVVLAKIANELEARANRIIIPPPPLVNSVHRQVLLSDWDNRIPSLTSSQPDLEYNVLQEMQRIHRLIKENGRQGDFGMEMKFGDLIPVSLCILLRNKKNFPV